MLTGQTPSKSRATPRRATPKSKAKRTSPSIYFHPKPVLSKVVKEEEKRKVTVPGAFDPKLRKDSLAWEEYKLLREERAKQREERERKRKEDAQKRSKSRAESENSEVPAFQSPPPDDKTFCPPEVLDTQQPFASCFDQILLPDDSQQVVEQRLLHQPSHDVSPVQQPATGIPKLEEILYKQEHGVDASFPGATGPSSFLEPNYGLHLLEEALFRERQRHQEWLRQQDERLRKEAEERRARREAERRLEEELLAQQRVRRLRELTPEADPRKETSFGSQEQSSSTPQTLPEHKVPSLSSEEQSSKKEEIDPPAPIDTDRSLSPPLQKISEQSFARSLTSPKDRHFPPQEKVTEPSSPRQSSTPSHSTITPPPPHRASREGCSPTDTPERSETPSQSDSPPALPFDSSSSPFFSSPSREKELRQLLETLTQQERDLERRLESAKEYERRAFSLLLSYQDASSG